MNLSAGEPHIFIPDGRPLDEALAGITHLGIGAHQDDLEFHALHGILECYEHEGRSFGGITCTDGGGCSRTGPYAEFSDAQMRAIRIEEQDRAAVIGRYGVMVQLGCPSAQARDRSNPALKNDLQTLLAVMQPEVVYTHNLADKHETHVAVARNVIAALRALPAKRRPKRLLGFEGWRALDWMLDSDKVRLDVSGRPELAAALAGVFDSQIAGGKRYDVAMDGRRIANATLDDPYGPDSLSGVTLAMDMTPLVLDDGLDPVEFTLGFVHRLEEDIRRKIR
ncbi:MAG: PIG-L deacetylase family protein [Terrimicrobiaceae bacterium]